MNYAKLILLLFLAATVYTQKHSGSGIKRRLLSSRRLKSQRYELRIWSRHEFDLKKSLKEAFGEITEKQRTDIYVVNSNISDGLKFRNDSQDLEVKRLVDTSDIGAKKLYKFEA